MFNSGAFDCKNCPRTNNVNASKFCPAWWEVPWQNNGVETIKQDCSYRLLPNMLQVVGRAVTLSMSTTHEMNNRLDAAEEMCKSVTIKMEALAKAFYLAADAAEKRRLENNAIPN
jgi:hypothetical protein